jgi:hypothetical protein
MLGILLSLRLEDVGNFAVDLLRELEGKCVPKGWIASVGAHCCYLCYGESYGEELGIALVNRGVFVVCVGEVWRKL